MHLTLAPLTLEELNSRTGEARDALAWYVAACFRDGRTPTVRDIETIRKQAAALDAAVAAAVAAAVERVRAHPMTRLVRRNYGRVMKHRRHLSRGDLLHRYARATGSSFDTAHDIHGATDIEDLRAIVETLERAAVLPGGRRSFARSQPTTTVQGVTR